MDYTIAAGEEADLPEEIAKDLIRAGFAVAVGKTNENTDEEAKKPGRPKKEA